jgi:hypothetical protein
MSFPLLESYLEVIFHILQVLGWVFNSYSCDLLVNPSMQVFSFGYYLPMVLVVICVMFGEDPTTDP